jgi:hypothetical protein
LITTRSSTSKAGIIKGEEAIHAALYKRVSICSRHGCILRYLEIQEVRVLRRHFDEVLSCTWQLASSLDLLPEIGAKGCLQNVQI